MKTLHVIYSHTYLFFITHSIPVAGIDYKVWILIMAPCQNTVLHI